MFLLRLLSRLPLSFLYILSDGLFVISYYLVRYRRDLILKNLSNSFPEKTNAELISIRKKFYRNLCDYTVETLKLITISEKELKKRMVFINPEVLQSCKDRNLSAFLLASHQFNWEWIIAAANLWVPINVDYVYQEQRSEFVNRFSLLTRGRFGSKGMKRYAVARELIKKRNTYQGIAIVADQFPGHFNDKRYWTNFLNQKTAFFEGVNNLVILMQYPAYFVKVSSIKRGYYSTEFIQIGNPPYEKNSNEVIENYIKQTEVVIKRNPSGWLWSHNRWKKKKEDA